ncbi:MAG: ABC transporter ATP-binding protein, partial [Lachnospiraceae bacterium]|nr:ABC transporter ATP-binding protein [Lachnospiraceae bacterium]
MDREVIISFEHYGFQYHAQAKPTLYDVSFSVHRGEKLLILGPSGCGKSTLVHSMNGLIPHAIKGEATGSVKVCGQETAKTDLSDISAHVGTVLQDTDGQFIGMTVAEDIAFALENQCVGEPNLHARVLEAAKLVHIEDRLSHAPEDLSGGQKQRVSMAGVLVDRVDLLLFDEPLANLDPAAGKEAIELIDELQQETGAAVVIVEHRLEDVLHRDVDRILLMKEGRIIYDGTPDALLSGPLLIETGIREPLYVTALKYAGVGITEDLQPHSIRSLRLTEEDKEKVRRWFRETKVQACPSSDETLLAAENLEFSYSSGYRALRGIDFELKKGELLAVVGKNGAGKSTFAKLVCGFEKESAGTLLWKGQPLSDYSIKERADRIGYVMQNPNQMICKTLIKDEVGFGLKMRGASQEQIDKKSEEALRVCGLWPFRNWPVSAVSFGQKKRLTIASILTLDPELLILDEPTAGQDYRHYTDIMEFLTGLNRRGISIIMITHDM